MREGRSGHKGDENNTAYLSTTSCTVMEQQEKRLERRWTKSQSPLNGMLGLLDFILKTIGNTEMFHAREDAKDIHAFQMEHVFSTLNIEEIRSFFLSAPREIYTQLFFTLLKCFVTLFACLTFLRPLACVQIRMTWRGC